MDEVIFINVLKDALEQYYEGTNEAVSFRTNPAGLTVIVEGDTFTLAITKTK